MSASGARSALVALPGFDVERVRADFPILARRVHGKPLVYLDNAASAQKPRAVIDAVAEFDANEYANVHRGVHDLSERATARLEAARGVVRSFLNAESDDEIIFLRGTTEAINLVAGSLARGVLSAGDEVVLTHMEHHSNLVPWQMLRDEIGIAVRVAPVDDRGQLVVEEFERCFNDRTKLASFVHVSNALGTVNPVRELVAIAKRHGAMTLIDGAQAAPHGTVDVRALGCDFYAFSGHKLFGPTGIGVLYGRRALLEKLPPWQGGGSMIRSVTLERTTYAPPPARFEAGTPNITGAIGLAAAIGYAREIGQESAACWERELVAQAVAELGRIPGVRLIGEADDRVGVVSFVVDGIHPHDVGTVLDHEGVAIRAGHHCAQPLMERFGVAATARASFAFYNTPAEVDALAAAVRKAVELFS